MEKEIARKSIRSERDYTTLAIEVLQKQHDRLITILEAYIQAAEWINQASLTVSERSVIEIAQRLISEHRRDRGAA